MLKITKDKFESYVLSATNATAEVFDMLTQELRYAENDLAVYIIGDNVYKVLDTYDERIKSECERYVCLLAFKNAMPSLDLVLTPTGFGVVNNQNVAPASADRVAKLATSITNSLDDCTENIVILLQGDKLWSDSPTSKMVFSSTIWNSRILRMLGFPGANLSLLRSKAIAIQTAEIQVQQKLSSEFFDELCNALRFNKQTESQVFATLFIQRAVCCLIDSNQTGYDLQISSLLKFLDCHIADFPTYKSSTAYEANHFTQYENEKEDTCFFWG